MTVASDLRLRLRKKTLPIMQVRGATQLTTLVSSCTPMEGQGRMRVL